MLDIEIRNRITTILIGSLKQMLSLGSKTLNLKSNPVFYPFVLSLSDDITQVKKSWKLVNNLYLVVLLLFIMALLCTQKGRHIGSLLTAHAVCVSVCECVGGQTRHVHPMLG